MSRRSGSRSRSRSRSRSAGRRDRVTTRLRSIRRGRYRSPGRRWRHYHYIPYRKNYYIVNSGWVYRGYDGYYPYSYYDYGNWVPNYNPYTSCPTQCVRCGTNTYGTNVCDCSGCY